MNFLRAFGDQIRIFGSSEDARVETATAEPTHTSAPELQSSVPMIAAEIPHCCFYCAWCASPILLPHDALGFAFGGPAIRKIETRAIGTVCSACGHTGVYSLFRGCPGYNSRHKFVPSRPAGRTMLLDWLPCEENTCVFPLPFFVTFDDEFNEANLKQFASKWLWDDLTCSAAHIVQSPKWLFATGPHRGAVDLTRVGARVAR